MAALLPDGAFCRTSSLEYVRRARMRSPATSAAASCVDGVALALFVQREAHHTKQLSIDSSAVRWPQANRTGTGALRPLIYHAVEP